MNYIEELKPGDTFEYDNKVFLLTVDFKKDNSRLCFSMEDGSPKWYASDSMVDKINIYKLDNTNTIIPIKEHKKDYDIKD